MKTKISILIICILLLTGCSRYLNDEITTTTIVDRNNIFYETNNKIRVAENISYSGVATIELSSGLSNTSVIQCIANRDAAIYTIDKQVHYIKKYDFGYVHGLYIDNVLYTEELLSETISSCTMMNFVNPDVVVNDDTFTFEANINNTYSFEVIDFIRNMVDKYNVALDGKIDISYVFENDELQKVVIDATDVCNKYLNNADVSSCSITLSNFYLNSDTTIDVPDLTREGIPLSKLYS